MSVIQIIKMKHVLNKWNTEWMLYICFNGYGTVPLLVTHSLLGLKYSNNDDLVQHIRSFVINSDLQTKAFPTFLVVSSAYDTFSNSSEAAQTQKNLDLKQITITREKLSLFGKY